MARLEGGVKGSFSWERLGRGLAVAAGLMDLGTGLGLGAAPDLTLALMGVTGPGAEALVFIRFVGAFVGAVGVTYLIAAMLEGERFWLLLRATITFRVAAGGFCTIALARGWLPSGWASVPSVDLTLAAVQGMLWWKGGR